MEPIGTSHVSPDATRVARVGDLSGVSATMLVTLAAKALAATDAPDLGYVDRRSEQILRELEIDPRRFGLNSSEVRAMVLRSLWFGRTVGGFFEHHPNGLCINLGCGLDASFEASSAADDGRFARVDVDLPDVIALRRRFFAESPCRRLLAADVTDPHLFDAMPWDLGRPAIVIAEGLLYFLRRAQVESMFRALAKAADARRANVEIAFDYASPFGAWIVARRPAHRQLGTTFFWTMHNPADLQRIDPRLEVVEDTNVFQRAMGSGAKQVDAFYRLVTGSGLGGCVRLSRTATDRI
jgi:O-methyltransferase involved in polyketide biosynthesis